MVLQDTHQCYGAITTLHVLKYSTCTEWQARTNDISEGWHNRFHVVVGKQHPSLYVFFEKLKKEQSDTEVMFCQLQLGHRVRRGISKKRLERERHISAVIAPYQDYVDNDDVLTCLRKLGHYVKLYTYDDNVSTWTLC